MESIVGVGIKSFLFSNGLISDFRPNHSTLDRLFLLSQQWREALNLRCEMRTISVNISQAFDGLLPCLDLQILYFWHQMSPPLMDHGLPPLPFSAFSSLWGSFLFIIDLSDSLENPASLFVEGSPLCHVISLPFDRWAKPLPSLQTLIETGACPTLGICLSTQTNSIHSPCLSEMTVRYALPYTSETNHLKRLNHSNFWVSPWATIFLGQTIFTRWPAKPNHRLSIHPSSCRVFPWSIWTFDNLWGLYSQLSGVLLSLLGWHPWLTPCPWCRGKQGPKNHWDLSQQNWISKPVAFAS